MYPFVLPLFESSVLEADRDFEGLIRITNAEQETVTLLSGGGG